MKRSLHLYLLASIVTFLFACDKEDDTGTNLTEPDHTKQGNWAGSGGITGGSNPYSFRNDHYRFEVFETGTVQLAFEATGNAISYSLFDSENNVIAGREGREVTHDLELAKGSYEIVVGTPQRIEVSPITGDEYNFSMTGEVSEPSLVAPTVNIERNSVALPGETFGDPNLSLYHYYSAIVGEGERPDALDVVFSSTEPLELYVYENGEWSLNSNAFGRESHYVWQELPVGDTYYFRIKAANTLEVEPGTVFNVWLNGRNYVFQDHGRDDPTD